MTRPLRFGILGAARIAPGALIKPAQANADVDVRAVAARDPVKAEQFAAKHSIPIVHSTYEALLQDPTIDAIYNPLPNGLHGRWTLAALKAGKAVLCEKPFTANAAEARAVAEAAAGSGLVVMEAFHYRYHALTHTMLDILASGELGKLRHFSAWMHFPLPVDDIRWKLSLAGGSLMDAGCYAVHLVRTLSGMEPEVVSAHIKERSPGVDRFAEAQLTFANGCTGDISASMLAAKWPSIGAEVLGSEGTMRVFNPIVPQAFHSLKVSSGGHTKKVKVAKQPSSYACQLDAFVQAVLHGKPVLSDVDDAIANMSVIDQCYLKAGLEPRRPAFS